MIDAPVLPMTNREQRNAKTACVCNITLELPSFARDSSFVAFDAGLELFFCALDGTVIATDDEFGVVAGFGAVVALLQRQTRRRLHADSV